MRIAPETADLSVRLSEESTKTNRNALKISQLRLPKGHHKAVKLTQVVPHVHLSTQSADLDDGLPEEVVGLPLELLLHARLDVIVLIPHSYLDAIRGVVAFTTETPQE